MMVSSSASTNQWYEKSPPVLASFPLVYMRLTSFAFFFTFLCSMYAFDNSCFLCWLRLPWDSSETTVPRHS